jgi:hypothetical protein
MKHATNIAFPLEVRKLTKAEIANRVGRALEMVELSGLALAPYSFPVVNSNAPQPIQHGKRRSMFVGPERVRIGSAEKLENRARGTVRRVTYSETEQWSWPNWRGG